MANQRGFVPNARGLALSIINDTSYDVLREFWSEISHKFNPAFRAEPATQGLDPIAVK